MKIENRQQFLLIVAIAAFALLVGVDFVLSPLSSWWTSRQEQIRVLQTKVVEGRQMLRRATAIRSRWDSMRTNALPANSSLAEQNVLQSVSQWAHRSGADLTSVTPQWKSGSTNYLNLVCRVESAGNLGTLSRFLYDLEKTPMALRLDSVELNSRDTTGQQMTMGLELNGLALLAPGKK